MVRIVYDLDTGEIYSATILFCWDDGSGGSGGGGGNNNNNQRISFELSCTTSVPRGGHGRCSVTAEGADGELLETGGFNFSWSSTTGASDSGKGMDRWEGTVTETATVTVNVAGQTDSATVLTTQRPVWSFQKLKEKPVYVPFGTVRHGRYRIRGSYPSVGNGGGPWSGRHYVTGPPVVTGTLEIDSDYHPTGLPRGPGADSTCAGASNLGSHASMWAVNDACGTKSVLDAWRKDTVDHEQDHEKGYSDCLVGSGGQSVMRELEAWAGSSSSGAHRIFRDFFNNVLDPAGARARGGSSGIMHIYRASGWSYPDRYFDPGESGGHGCEEER